MLEAASPRQVRPARQAWLGPTWLISARLVSAGQARQPARSPPGLPLEGSFIFATCPPAAAGVRDADRADHAAPAPARPAPADCRRSRWQRRACPAPTAVAVAAEAVGPICHRRALQSARR